MKIAVFGTGYVGLVSGTCFAELGNEVVCVDIDETKIKKLKKGEIPIFEPGLKEMVQRNSENNRLIFTTNAKKAIEENDLIFICVGTPQNEDGSADLKFVNSVAKTIGQFINGYKVVATKSTVPVGTNHKIKEIISSNSKYEFDVASVPEFLKEGSAVKDFMAPDRIVIGLDNESQTKEKAKAMLYHLFEDLERVDRQIVFTQLRSAELIKYTANSFLAMKISFINEVANLCEKVNADIKDVYRGIALDKRIGHRFLQSGLGYGGSCFPKDVRAMIKTGEYFDSDFFLLEAVDRINKKQRFVAINKLEKHLGDVKDKTISVLGLAFKPKTDDLREAPAIDIIKRLLAKGANIRAFDPIAQDNAKKIFQDSDIEFAKDPYEAIAGSDAMVIATEWDEFRSLDKKRMLDLMNSPIIIDGRNVLNKKCFVGAGFIYEGIGR